ncbi:MAG: maleylpyruvate isomerase N-terminal domain-containing protein [Anaerolineales bacterium]
MNAQDILAYGHGTLLAALDGIPLERWEQGGVCGTWGVKDIVAHLGSYEIWHAEVLNGFLDGGPSPLSEQRRARGNEFNDWWVLTGAERSASEVLDEYLQAHQALVQLAAKVPKDIYPKAGTLPWYGSEYSLDDFLVYSNYGHKREHSAQFNVFKDRMVENQ